MASKFVDRTLTVVVTATLTSAAWIVGGGSFMRYAEDQKAAEATEAIEKAEVSPDPKALATPVLDTSEVSEPETKQTDQLVIPVLNIKREDLQDTFTDKRGEGAPLHEALDILADKGTTVIAAGPGEVEKIFTSASGGKTLYVRSPDRETIHFYAHLDEYAEGLREGQRIRRGQRLGTVGSTGNAEAEAPHLHFAILRTSADAEWWEPATAINPYPLLTGKNQRP